MDQHQNCRYKFWFIPSNLSQILFVEIHIYLNMVEMVKINRDWLN